MEILHLRVNKPCEKRLKNRVAMKPIIYKIYCRNIYFAKYLQSVATEVVPYFILGYCHVCFPVYPTNKRLFINGPMFNGTRSPS